MFVFNLQNAKPSDPKYIQLSDLIRQTIRTRKLVANDALPSSQKLAADLGMNRHTVMKAMSSLVAEGWLVSAERVGYKVADTVPIEHSQRISNRHHAQFSETKHYASTQYRLVKDLSDDKANKTKEAVEYKYNFAGGQPDLNEFPFSEFKRYMSNSLNYPQIDEYSYGRTAGSKLMREKAADYLRTSRGIVDRDIVMTNGSQEALYIIAQLFLQQGDRVAVDTLAYPPAMQAFQNTGARLVPIEQDTLGMSPTNLEYNIQQGSVRFIYLTPLHHYPTTKTLPIGRRHQIYEIAKKYSIPIIEDDYDHEFHYKCQPLAPMVCDDPHQLVIYIATFSKLMFPAARLGILAIPQALTPAVLKYRALVSNKPNVLVQEAVANWMASGGFARHLRRTTRLNLKRRDAAVEYLLHTNVFDFEVPDGGMALWLKLKNPTLSASSLCEQAKQADIFLQSEQEFQINRQDNVDRCIRVGFAGMSQDKFAQGMDLFCELLN